ncbi:MULTISPECIES: transglutaminaseTgpA domain-containing protein [unclassified Nocardioides]|uniref:transglutaminase family protein n=1 Tax=unclassified Nocardioides TaxID=2615069 RepID=UPI0036180D56
MTRPRGRLGANVLFAATAAGTTWLAMNAWRDLTEVPGDFLNPLLLMAVVVAGTGVAGRWWRWPGPAVVAFQVAVTAMLTSLMLTGSPLPVGGAWAELTATFRDAIDSSQTYRAPVPIEAPPVDPLLIVGGLACLLLVDILAGTMHRVPLAGLPLLAIFSIPVGMIDGAVVWWVFAATAAGYLAMLALHESDQVARWGRPLGADRETGDPIAFGAGATTVRSTAGLVGGAATAIAVLLPVVIPATGLHLFDFGPGSGGGDDIRVDNPTADLVRDLKRGDDVPLVKVTTNDPDPSYLRILTLTRFSEAEWSPGDREVPSDHLANGSMPPPQGVASDMQRQEHPYQVTIMPEFDSRWLPTQPPVSIVDAAGDWRYDQRTMDFIAGDEDLSTEGLEYTMTAVDLDVTAGHLEDAGTSTGKVDAIFTDLPDDMPAIVHDLAVQVTEGKATAYEQAAALQEWFRSEFTYSLDQADGNGIDALEDFLTDGPGGRVGYCEQFASAMAVMARDLGIPARVAIGFLNPSAEGAGSWVYSSDDMHAWPELFFDGVGWVRFEPTPPGRASEVPDYTVPGTPDIDPTESTAPSESSSAAAPTTRPLEPSATASADDETADTGSAIAWGPTIGGLAAVVVVLGGLLLPRLVRARRRERRLSAGAVEPVWDELQDTALDLGVPWPPGRSPRRTRDVLVDHLGTPVDTNTAERPAHGPNVAPEAVAALDRLVLTLELARYSRAGATIDPVRLRADGETCIAALAGGAARSARRRAAWWPRTVLTLRSRTRMAPTPLEARYGGVVDNMS